MSNQDKLPEKKFINESYKKNPLLLWIWVFVIGVIVFLLWVAWFTSEEKSNNANIPKDLSVSVAGFFNVTNRQFSLFLWQHPSYMRVNYKKTGYLPAFQVLDKITVEPNLAEQKVVAPPEIIFLYHAWSRLLGNELIPRPIPVNEFIEFLEYCEEWQPQFWKMAPSEYVNLMQELKMNTERDLQDLPFTTLPLQVRKAFQGWKNNFKEADQINALSVTYGEIESFLKAYPNYSRNYWRNIYLRDVPSYLITPLQGGGVKTDPIPSTELAPFLKVAFFNFHQLGLRK